MSRQDETRRLFEANEDQAPCARDETLSLSAGAVANGQYEGASLAKACSACGARFSGEARFCPFDGEPLGQSRPLDAGSDPLLGALVAGRYEIDGVLGEGGMGRVYRARHGTLGRSFALKVLKPELASDSALATRFTLEAKAAASVCSPYVVQITDFGELDSGQPFFVMELLEGRSLGVVIRQRGPLSPSDIVRIARPVAEGLGAAHAAGVIHRDLKPDNVHVAGLDTESPTVKVLDFGLAKVAGSSKLTRDGMVFGTPHYMSPEQAAGEPLDHRVDIYSLGVVMYEMATGRTPFESDTYMGVLTQHLHIMPTRPSALLGTDSLGALEDIILRCLAKRPSQRFSGMEELVAELRQFERGCECCSAVPLRRVARDAVRSGEPPVAAAPGADWLRNRETIPAPPVGPALAPQAVVDSSVGRISGGGSPLGAPLSWVVVGGSLVSVIALVYLLIVPRNGGPAPAASGDPAVLALTPSSACPPTVPTTASRAADFPEPVLNATARPVSSADALGVTQTTGQMAAPGFVQRPAATRSVAAATRPAGQAAHPSSRPSRAPSPQHQPNPSTPVAPQPSSKMPTLSGGDIVDPWAQ